MIVSNKKKIVPELQKQLAILYRHLANEKELCVFNFREKPLTVDALQLFLLSPSPPILRLS